MNILYLTQTNIKVQRHAGIYSDLVCGLIERGHHIDIVRATGNDADYQEFDSFSILKVNVGNQFGVSPIKKGLIFLGMAGKVKKAIKKHLKGNSYDLILYESPPVVFAGVVKYCKKLFGCKTYLMQKDIFPQNALDLGLLKRSGLKGLVYKYFERKNRLMLKVADKVGCMSEANMRFLLKHERVPIEKLELFPNASYPVEVNLTEERKQELFAKYQLSRDKINVLYGGNLGKPQAVDDLIEALSDPALGKDFNFVFFSDGTDAPKVKAFAQKAEWVKFFEHLPNTEYMEAATLFDIGMVSLDKRFTIPNYPSKVLSYMEAALPVVAMTDEATDFKDLITQKAQCGLWSKTGDADTLKKNLNTLKDNPELRKQLGQNGKKYKQEHFKVEDCVQKLERFVKGQ